MSCLAEMTEGWFFGSALLKPLWHTKGLSRNIRGESRCIWEKRPATSKKYVDKTFFYLFSSMESLNYINLVEIREVNSW